MGSRAKLQEAIESGEEKNGSIEFKESLSKNLHLSGEKRDSLVAQLRHRVLSGDGTATYVIGVQDCGEIKGLSQGELEETLDVLSVLSESADSHISSVETWSVGDSENKLVALATIKEGKKELETNHLVVGTAGHVDHGKSTLVGSLVTGDSDDGKGSIRSYLDVQPHEIRRGLSADLSYAVYGFTDNNKPIHLTDPNRNQERSRVVEKSDKLVSFVDTVGHEPWLHTTIRGLVGQRLDYGLLVVSAEEGPTDTTQEHLGVLLAMGLPTIVAITKTDLVEEEQVNRVEKEVEQILRDAGCTALPSDRYQTETLVNDISSEVIPVVRTSAVSSEGLDTLNKLFSVLEKNQVETDTDEFKMYIDKTYVIEGVGTVVSGSVKSGTISVGDEIYLGPTENGDYIETKCRSIEIHYHQVDSASAGQLVSIAIRNVNPEQVRRGMVLTEEKLEPVEEFEAEVMILNHPTRIKEGYEPVIHLETISEAIELYPEDSTLLPGDKGKSKVKFKFNPYLIEPGQRFIFREGDSKGVGTVLEVHGRNKN